jgi:hypothetical protein
MDKDQLLSTFNEKVETYARHRGFIDKAKAQEGKFSAAVIEKVCLDNEIRSSEVVDEIVPLVQEIEDILSGLQSDLDEHNESSASANEQMEELTLRQAIGELTDDEFESEASDFKTSLEEAGGKISAIEEEQGNFSSALDTWTDLAEKAGHNTGRAGAVEPDPEDEPIEAEPEIDDGDGTHSSHDIIREDMSAVLGEVSNFASVQVNDDDDGVAIEATEAEDDHDMPSVDVDFGFDEDASEELEAAGAEEVEIDLVGGESLVEIHGESVDAMDDNEDGTARRALLLYQEGTAEEQIYPFTGDEITIGRGRDNDIQIKNDSKVSRHHCKIYRKGDNFYIQDNKSSNGSLVNGELITERRLFGGEEIIIGETFFRFRIME